MRKVTSQTVDAFMARESKSVANTTSTGDALYLHGHRIAWHGEHNGASGVFLSMCGWGTPTTRERLNGVLRMMGHQVADGCLNFYQRNHEQRIGAHAWDVTDAGVGGEVVISTRAVVFVAHPCTAKGMRAVRVFEEGSRPAVDLPETVEA